MNFLVTNQEQVFNQEWKKQLCTPITDTGNALDDHEILNLSEELNIPALLDYRNAVGLRTRDIIQTLSAKDMKRKVSSCGIQKIRYVGGVTEQADSIWLLDYWGNKDVAGILLMPPTRHIMLHLNDCCKWKQQMRSGKKLFHAI